MANRLSILNFEASVVPEFKEARGKDWILYGAEGEFKNRYPDFLLELYRNSAKHHAIINSKRDYICGRGWSINTDGATTVQKAKMEQFVKHPNAHESLDDILVKVAHDLELYGGYALEVIYDSIGEKVAAIYHADFAKYRVSEDGSCYYYSDDWSKFNPEFEKIEAFNWKEPGGKQLLYVKSYQPNCQYYPLPSYLGAINYIDLDRKVSDYFNQGISNGFMAGTLINFNSGIPTEEEQNSIEKMVKSKFTGTENANSILLNFSDSRERSADIQQLNSNDFDKRFDLLNKTIQQELYAGHQISDPALFGIKEEGIFSSRNQLVDSFELFQNTYVNARQQFIERTFNDLAALQGLEGRLTISDTAPISVQFSESTIISVMTEDEIREAVGLAAIVKEEGVESVDSKTKDAQASLKGSVGGVSGIITLLQGVKEGQVDANSAIAILVELYGFEPAKAAATINGDPLPEVAAFNKQQNDDKIALAYLKKTGSFDFDVVGDRRFNFENFETAHIREEECLKYWFAELGPIESAILDILVKEPSTPFLSIARSLQISNDRMMAAIQTLNEANAINIIIKEIAGSTQRVVDVTEEGKRIIKDIKPVEEEFGIGYVYDLRPELKGKQPVLIETSRKFCEDLIAESRPSNWRSDDIQEIGEGYTGKVWSLTEIQQLTMETGRNVWNRGGGWWGKSIHCRHEWRQVLITRKAKK
jgi:DNA-binding MarR family transcriptional regulator/sulfur carrier protein ThiS